MRRREFIATIASAAAWPARTSASHARGFDVIELGCLDQGVYGGNRVGPFTGARGDPVAPDRDTAPRRASSQLKVCNLSFSELSTWRSNTCVAMPEKSAGLPSLSLPLALQFAVP